MVLKKCPEAEGMKMNKETPYIFSFCICYW